MRTNIKVEPSLTISSGAKCVVVVIDYRLAPEHPFPAGVDDVVECLAWIYKNGQSLNLDLKRIAVGGLSAFV